MLRGLLILILLAPILTNCTVLEDRSDCPNYLTIDFSEVERGIKEWQLWMFDKEDNLIFKDTIYRCSYSSPYLVKVPRSREVRCMMWGNIRGGTQLSENYSLGTFLTKEPDITADSLYYFLDTISTNGEDSYLKVIPLKEFATLDIYMKGWIDNDFAAELKLECANSGFYVDKRLCGSNSFTTIPVHDLGNYFTHFRCRFLRQRDTENLILSVIIKKKNIDGSISHTLIEKDIPIGLYLENNNYNMQSLNLKDITMEIDYSYNLCVIKIEDWSETYNLLEEI